MSAFVFNNVLVTDPTIQQPGFDLPRHLLSHFRAGQECCLAKLYRWVLVISDLCACGQR